MELHTISSLLKQQTARTLDIRVSHLEDIDWHDDNGIPHAVVVLGIVDEGSVVYTGTCVLKGDVGEIEQLRKDLGLALKEQEKIEVRLSTSSTDAYTWPELRAASDDDEDDEDEEDGSGDERDAGEDDED